MKRRATQIILSKGVHARVKPGNPPRSTRREIPMKRRKLFGAHLARPAVKSLDVQQAEEIQDLDHQAREVRAAFRAVSERAERQSREFAAALRAALQEFKPWPHLT